MNQTVRVYADGRLCIPSTVLDEWREKRAKRKQALNKIWVSSCVDGALKGTVLITAEQCSGSSVLSSKSYDLSVRHRVLFGPPKGVKQWKPGQLLAYNVNALGIHIEVPIEYETKPKPVVKQQAPVFKPPTPRSRVQKSPKSLEQKFNAAFRVNLCAVLALPEYRSLTLGDLAQAFPDLTVGEIVSA